MAGLAQLRNTVAALVMIATAANSAAAQSPPLVSSGVYAQHLVDPTLRLDPGRGIVGLRMDADVPPIDSLALYPLPHARAPLGWFVANRAATEGEPFFIRAPSRVQPNAIEFAYEESALPLDSLTPDRGWARVIYAFDSAGKPLTAWTPLSASNAAFHLWTNYFGDKALLFLPAISPEFFDAPNGKPLRIPLAGSKCSTTSCMSRDSGATGCGCG